VPANLQLCGGSTVECRHIYNGKLQSRSIGTSVTHRPPESKSNAVYQSLLISNSIRIIPQNKSRQRGGKSINFVAKLGNGQRPYSLQVSVRCAYRASRISRPTLSLALSHFLSCCHGLAPIPAPLLGVAWRSSPPASPQMTSRDRMTSRYASACLRGHGDVRSPSSPPSGVGAWWRQ